MHQMNTCRFSLWFLRALLAGGGRKRRRRRRGEERGSLLAFGGATRIHLGGAAAHFKWWCDGRSHRMAVSEDVEIARPLEAGLFWISPTTCSALCRRTRNHPEVICVQWRRVFILLYFIYTFNIINAYLFIPMRSYIKRFIHLLMYLVKDSCTSQ